jgi:hypothetical protein
MKRLPPNEQIVKAKRDLKSGRAPRAERDARAKAPPSANEGNQRSARHLQEEAKNVAELIARSMPNDIPQLLLSLEMWGTSDALLLERLVRDIAWGSELSAAMARIRTRAE